MTENTRTRLVYIAVVIAMAIVFWPGLRYHFELAFSTELFYDDERQYLPVFDAFRADPTPLMWRQQYYLDALCPPGFVWITRAIFATRNPQLWMGLLTLSCWAIFFGALGRTAWRLGGAWAAWGTVFLAASSTMFTSNALGGFTPRIVAYPLVAVGAWALTEARLGVACAIIWIGALLYPQVGLMIGVMLAWWLLLIKEPHRQALEGWSLRGRAGFVAAVAAVSLVLLLPQLAAQGAYGDRLVATDLTEFPEIGPDGRYSYGDRLPLRPMLLPLSFMNTFFSGLGDGPIPSLSLKLAFPAIWSVQVAFIVSLIIAINALVGSWSLGREDAAFRRLGTVLWGSIALYFAAFLLYPHLYMPSRYHWYTVPVLLVIATPVAIRSLIPGRDETRKQLVATGLLLVLFIVMGGRGDVNELAERETRHDLMDTLRALPHDVVIAGWPRTMDNVGLIAHQNTILDYETHQVLHRGVAQRLRGVANALFDAYYAQGPEPLRQLRDEFGVTHLLLEPERLRQAEPSPYFAPYDERIQVLHSQAGGQVWITSQAAVANVDDAYLLYDLRDLNLGGE